MSSGVGVLAGYTVGVTCDRRAGELAGLFGGQGARVILAPTVETLSLARDDQWLQATRAIIAEAPEVVVLSTGYGTRTWLAAADSTGLADDLLESVSAAQVMARGPKAAGAALAAGLQVSHSTPPTRSVELVSHLRSTAATGSRIAVQLDGSGSQQLVDGLRHAGFEVQEVAVYRSTLPSDAGAAERLVMAVCDRTVDAVAFTSAVAVDNFFAIAERLGQIKGAAASFGTGNVPAVCVGHACAEAASRHGVRFLVVPRRPRLGAMVQAYGSCVAGRALRLVLAGCDITFQGRMVMVNGDGPVMLSDRERHVFEVLTRKPGAVVSKPVLLREVWGANEVDEHLAEVAVARLRQRLGHAGEGIETVVRRGYRLSPA